ncbi:MAG TPA: tetratricopeptide repeat protein [Thermoanaerobaculia bacterium]|jgi:Flp pilus assembly protein TadD|nr:tetratricopeptide repeat protein [Thermoanaerobaculia bacterium]
MRTLYPILAFLALAALPAGAQQKKAPPKPAPKAPAAAQQSSPQTSAQPSPQTPPEVTQALQRYQANDLKGAIAVLEPFRAKKDANPASLALLGAFYLEAGRPQDSLAVLGPLTDSTAAGPMVLHTAAKAALAVGQKDQAETYLSKAVEKAPGSPASRDLGLLRGSEGRIAESYRLLLPWAKAHPEDQEARISALYGAIELDRSPEAGELLKGLPQDDPRVRLLSARLQLLLQKPREAIALLEPLLKGGPPALDLSVRHYLADAHLAIGESNEAIRLIQGKVGNDPSLALLLGRAQYRAGNPAEAVATLKPFSDQILGGSKPTELAARKFAADFALEYGQALLATSDWTGAMSTLEKAASLDPENLQTWQLLGRAQLAAGRREEGARSMERFRQLQSQQKPNSQKVNEQERGTADPTGRNLEEARKMAAAGRTDEALSLIRQEIDLAPTDPRPRAAEISTLIAVRRTDEALKSVERALAGSPGNPDLLYLRGAVRMGMNDLPAAEKDFRQALAARPDHVAAMNDLAVLLMTDGRKDEARELLRKVLEIRPGDPLATANLKSLE